MSSVTIRVMTTSSTPRDLPAQIRKVVAERKTAEGERDQAKKERDQALKTLNDNILAASKRREDTIKSHEKTCKELNDDLSFTKTKLSAAEDIIRDMKKDYACIEADAGALRLTIGQLTQDKALLQSKVDQLERILGESWEEIDKPLDKPLDTAATGAAITGK